MPGSVEEVGLSLVVLSLVFACAALIRRWSRPLRKLFIPTAVIGGFLVLGLGPEGMGRLLGGTGLFPESVFAVWRQLPAHLVTLMSASLLLGEHLPPLRKTWSISGAHVIMISVMSMGQFAIGGILVWLLLEPMFGIDRKAGALLEMSFNGGHGTLAGLTPVFQHYGVGDLVNVGLGLATIGILSGIVVGTTLVNYAIRSPSISVVRRTPPSPDEDFDLDHHLPGPDDRPMDEWKGMAQVTAAAVFLGSRLRSRSRCSRCFARSSVWRGPASSTGFRSSPSRSRPRCSSSSAQGGTTSSGPSIVARSKGSAEWRSMASSSARSAPCRWERSARTSAR
jgi:Na+/glutamate symporter